MIDFLKDIIEKELKINIEKIEEKRKNYFYFKVKTLDEREEIIDFFLKNKNRFHLKDEIKSSISRKPIFYDIKNKFYIVIKPLTGMSSNTRNASISEFIPCFMFYMNINKYDVNYIIEQFNNEINNDFKNLRKYFLPIELKKIKEYFTSVSEINPKILSEKIENGIASFKYFKEKYGNNIKEIKWGGQIKPFNLPKNHKGDVYLILKNTNQIISFSLKTGKKNSNEFKTSPYLNSFFRFFNKNIEDNLARKVSTEVFEKINIDYYNDYYRKGRYGLNKNNILIDLEKKNNKLFNELYDLNLKIIHDYVIDLISNNNYKKNVIDFFKNKIFNEFFINEYSKIPIIYLKAFGMNCKEINFENEVNLFKNEKNIRRIYAIHSKTSKQRIYIIAETIFDDIISFNFDLRASEGKLFRGMNLRLFFL